MKDSKNRKVFRGYIILVTLGRSFLLFCLITLFYAIGNFSYFVITSPSAIMVFGLILFLLMALLCAFVFNFLWPLCWGKLVVTDVGVKWKCLFMKTRKLTWDQCRFRGMQVYSEGNVIRYDMYNTGFAYVYLSTKPYPSKFNGKINKLKCTDEFIKFPANADLCMQIDKYISTPEFYNYYKWSARKSSKKKH